MDGSEFAERRGGGLVLYHQHAKSYLEFLRTGCGSSGAFLRAGPPLSCWGRQLWHRLYEDIAGGPPANETALLRHVNKSAPNPKGPPAFNAYYFTDGAWAPSTPLLDPGEGVLIIHPYLSLKLSPTNSPPGYVATWPRNGRLEQADTPNGPWTAITNAVSPYRIITESGLEGSKFYRVVESWDPLDF